MEVHAVEDAILTLPGPIDQWAIDSVLWEGTSTHALRKSTEGYLEVRVPKGIWSIDIAGPLNDGVQFTGLSYPIEWTPRLEAGLYKECSKMVRSASVSD